MISKGEKNPKTKTNQKIKREKKKKEVELHP